MRPFAAVSSPPRALAIPTVAGITEATRIATAPMTVLVDALAGELVFDATLEQLAAFLACKERHDEASSHALSAATRECITRDGVRISLYANIGRPDEVDQVIAWVSAMSFG
jgi:phosphotransferase system enzyme I (PtsI)